MELKEMSEDRAQMELVSWFRKLHYGVMIYHTPNGGSRNKSEASKLKCMGVTPGIPDLFIPEWLLWIEMKTTKGKLSEDQKDVIRYMESIGHECLVCYGLEDAKEKISHFCKKKFDTM
jgi:hypothetical protein